MAGLIILDRDGVLNQIVVDAEHGTIDSPLNPDQVRLCAGVEQALASLTQAGYTLAVATNQPAAAKGKTTHALLQATHERVIELAQSAGGRIASSHLCLHRAEDRCSCRKPAPGLLEQAIALHPEAARREVWMAGDGVTDVEAGRRVGAKTAFFGPRKCDACRVMETRDLRPDFWGDNLLAFTHSLLHAPSGRSRT